MTAEDLARLDAAVTGATREELPTILGALARLQAIALGRLAAPASEAKATAEDRLLSLPEAASVLGVPEDRAYDLARQRRFPVVVIGKYRRVRESALRAFIAENEDGPQPVTRRRAG